MTWFRSVVVMLDRTMKGQGTYEVDGSSMFSVLVMLVVVVWCGVVLVSLMVLLLFVSLLFSVSLGFSVVLLSLFGLLVAVVVRIYNIWRCWAHS